MSIVVRLLGDPRIERDGEIVNPPRGRKAWALLAYLILSERPPSRQAVTEVLFPEAADPFAALRWTLSELRRVTDWPTTAIGGDPLHLELPAGHRIDLLEMTQSPRPEPDSESGGDLLGSMAFDALPAFDYWLQVQRRHTASRHQTQLRDDALADLAAGRCAGATQTALRLVECDPLEPRNQETLLRSLVAGGRPDEAKRLLALCEDLFARELNAPLPTTLIEAASGRSSHRAVQMVTTTAEARARLEAGRAAVSAGAIERGIGRLRGAVALADESGELEFRAEALLQLGEALAHGPQDRTTEVTTILHQAIAAAHRVEREDLASRANSELAYVHIATGDAAEAYYWLSKAEEHRSGDDHLLSVTTGLRGLAFAETAHYDRSLAMFDMSAMLAGKAGKPRQVAWSHAMSARTHLVRNDLASAHHHVEEALEIASTERWAAFLPFPQVQRGELLRQHSDFSEAQIQLENAYALASEVGDLCWESLASRSLAAVARDQGQSQAAVEWTAKSLNHQLPNAWIQASAIEGKCHMVAPANPALGRSTAQQLAAFADKNGFREFSARAAIQLGALGDTRAASAAVKLSRDIDNPALQAAATAGTPTE